ncbi:MAG: hypothetical protein EXR51_06890 [Dehalococcoidia bacterium]|nr:hypothetical protein [Dehalococcoidia bacterium]
MTLHWSRVALRSLLRLEPPTADRVRAAVARFAATREGDIRKLAGGEGEYRLRVGEYRVRFTYLEERVLLVLHVLHRRDAYR